MASQYEASRAAERRYAARLKKLARTIARIIKEHIDGNTLRDVDEMMRKLQQYAEQLDEWARKTAAMFIKDTSRTNEKAWVAHSKKLRKQLRSAMAKGTIGLTARQLQDQQVTLIKSLPIEAGRRAQQLAQEAMMDSTRAAELSKQLLETERITKNRATLIARTEIAKANAAMTRSRAQFVGVTHYIWRTAQDGDVRPSHQAMEGQVCEFASPPMVEGEGFHHPGEIWNCFTGDTLVRLDGDLRRLFRAPYDGAIVDIHAGGIVFSVTPNHPILTRAGWRAAGEIKRGEELVCDGLPAVAENDEHLRVATFVELYRALAAKGERVSGAEFDFYGDRPAGDVDCVAIDQQLLDRVMPSGAQGVKHLALPNTDGRSAIAAGVDGEVAHPLCPRCARDLAQCGGAGCGEADKVCLGAVANIPTVRAQQLDDGRASAAEGVGNLLHTHLGGVGVKDEVCGQGETVVSAAPADGYADGVQAAADNIGVAPDGCCCGNDGCARAHHLCRVDDVRVRDWSGHVYTLETGKGWYAVTPAMIISQNCRCFAEPVLTDDADAQ